MSFFRAITLHNRLFAQPPTVYHGKHHVTSVAAILKEIK